MRNTSWQKRISVLLLSALFMFGGLNASMFGFAQTYPVEDPYLHYSFNNDGLVPDLSGNDREGIPSGSPAVVKVGTSESGDKVGMIFNGTNQQIEATNSKEIYGEMTIHAEFKQTVELNNGVRTIVGKYGPNPNTNREWALVTSDGKIVFYAWDRNITNWRTIESGITCAADTIYRATVTIDSTESGYMATLYVDGVQKGKLASDWVTWSQVDTLPITVGSAYNQQRFAGTLYDVAIYQGALDAAEVAVLPDTQPNNPSQFRYDFANDNYNEQMLFPDSSGNDRHGAPLNNPVKEPVVNLPATQGLTFGQAGQKITVPGASNFDGAMTVHASFVATTNMTGNHPLVSKVNLGAGDHREWELILNGGKISFVRGNSTGGGWTTPHMDTDISPVVGQRYDVTATVSADGIAKLYVNGELKVTGNSWTKPESKNPILIGAAGYNGTTTNTNRLFPSPILDAAIYTKEMTAAEVAGLEAGIYPEENRYVHYDFTTYDPTAVNDVSGNDHNGKVEGTAGYTEAVLDGKGMTFTGAAGNDQYVQVQDSLNFSGDMTIDVTFSPTANNGTRTIVAKNRTQGAPQKREWSLVINNGEIQFLYNNSTTGIKWQYLESNVSVRIGDWYQVIVTVKGTEVTMYVNGSRMRGNLDDGAECDPWTLRPTADTVPIFIGGTPGAQWLNGTIDDVTIYPTALDEEQIEEIINTDVDNPEPPERYELWDKETPFPSYDQVRAVEGVTYSSIKITNPVEDLGDDLWRHEWQHGASIISFNGKMYSTFGHNMGRENTVGESAMFYVSEDEGLTWTYHSKLDSLDETVTATFEGAEVEGRTFGISHGLFTVQNDKLYALLPVFDNAKNGRFSNLKTYAFELDEANGTWINLGVLIDNLWPLREPEQLGNDTWFISGCTKEWHGAAAVSRGDKAIEFDEHGKLIPWDTKVIEEYTIEGITSSFTSYFTESAALVEDDGTKITLIMRNQNPLESNKNSAGVAISTDYGQTFSISSESNMPLTTSKPYAGKLSDGRNYLIGNSAGYTGSGSRARLTIALTEQGGSEFKEIYAFRVAAIMPDSVESLYTANPLTQNNQSLSYPHCHEYNGKLYVTYSAGVSGTANSNHMELAIIPISSLTPNVTSDIAETDVNGANATTAVFGENSYDLSFADNTKYAAYTELNDIDGLSVQLSNVTAPTWNKETLLMTLSPSGNWAGTDGLRLSFAHTATTRVTGLTVTDRAGTVLVEAKMVKSLMAGLNKEIRVEFNDNSTCYSIIVNGYGIALPASAYDDLKTVFASGTQVLLGGTNNIHYTLNSVSTEVVDEEVQAVIGLIDDIGAVTPGSEAPITLALNAYDELDSIQQDQVSNYSSLEEAVEQFNTYRPVILGATIRMSGVQGMRFGTEFNTAAVNGTGYSIAGYGTVLLAASRWNLSMGELTKDTASATIREGTVLDASGATMEYGVTLVRIPPDHYESDVMSRSYIIYQDGVAGEKYTVYSIEGEGTTNNAFACNIKEIAKRWNITLD